MSTAQAYLPVRLYAQRGRLLSLRAIAALSFAIALCCASLVFATLYNLDQSYPVAAVHSQSRPLSDTSSIFVSQTAPRSTIAGAVSGAKAEQGVAKPLSVARTHDELLALERRGERNYVEFSIARSDRFQPIGPVHIGLWRTDPKHSSVRISVLIDGRRTDFKRVDLYEALSIPMAHSQRLELVINSVARNHITGYLAEPKKP